MVVVCDPYQGVGTFSGTTFAGSTVGFSITATVTNDGTSHVDTITGTGSAGVTGLPAGTYTIEVTSSAPAGWRSIQPSSQTVELGCNQHLTVVFWSVMETYDVVIPVTACNCLTDPGNTTWDFTVDDGVANTCGGTTGMGSDFGVGRCTLPMPPPGSVPLTYTVVITGSNRPWYDLPYTFTDTGLPGCGSDPILGETIFGTTVPLKDSYVCASPANTGTTIYLAPKLKVLQLSDAEGSCVMTYHWSSEPGVARGCTGIVIPAGGHDIWTGEYSFTTDGAVLQFCPYSAPQRVGYLDHQSVTVTNYFVAYMYFDVSDGVTKWRVFKSGMYRPCNRSCANYNPGLGDFNNPSIVTEALRTDNGTCGYGMAEGLADSCDPTVALSWASLTPVGATACMFGDSFLGGGALTE